MLIEYINFAFIIKQQSFDYKILASYLLAKFILDFFDVTDVIEDHTGIIEETGDERALLHINLDEKETRGRWLTPEGRNAVLDRYSLLTDNIGRSHIT